MNVQGELPVSLYEIMWKMISLEDKWYIPLHSVLHKHAPNTVRSKRSGGSVTSAECSTTSYITSWLQQQFLTIILIITFCQLKYQQKFFHMFCDLLTHELHEKYEKKNESTHDVSCQVLHSQLCHYVMWPAGCPGFQWRSYFKQSLPHTFMIICLNIKV